MAAPWDRLKTRACSLSDGFRRRGVTKTRPRDPLAPFPLKRAWYWEEDDRPDDEIGHVLQAVHQHGSVLLGADGVDMNWVLITAGPQRGSVWRIDEAIAFPYVGPDVPPLGAQAPGMGLLKWISHWHAGHDWFEAAWSPRAVCMTLLEQGSRALRSDALARRWPDRRLLSVPRRRLGLRGPVLARLSASRARIAP